MKKRILPFGLVSFVILGIVAIFLFAAGANNKEPKPTAEGGQTFIKAKEYLAKIRNNQHTGLLNPKDVIRADQQIAKKINYKSGNAVDLDWIEMGPDNVGGRTRAIIFDNQDESGNTLYAASVSGGIFKSTNYGSYWSKINSSSGTANLNVTSMVQDDNGTIFASTGEGFNIQSYSALEEFGFESGFVGRGIFKSSGDDSFTLVSGTEPSLDDEELDWAFINKLSIDKNNDRLFAATHNSLKYASLSNLSEWKSDMKHSLDSSIYHRDIEIDSIVTCDTAWEMNGSWVILGGTYEVTTSKDDTTAIDTERNWIPFESQGNVHDVQISEEGYIITSFNNLIYVSESGNVGEFVNRSIYPSNPDAKGRDFNNYNTHIKITSNSSGTVFLDRNSEFYVENDWADDVSNDDGFPRSEDAGRVSFAIAPSDQNIVYAMAALDGENSLQNIYLSENKGKNWRAVGPGESEDLNILGSSYVNDDGDDVAYYQGDYANTIAVFPNNPYRILAGGINMWEGEKVSETNYYQWSQKSFGTGQSTISPFYIHNDHHAYLFKPGSSTQFVIATDGGNFKATVSGSGLDFISINKLYNVTQYYSVDVSNEIKEVIGGAQDNGSLHIDGSTTTPMRADPIWNLGGDPFLPDGGDGGYCAFSNIRVELNGELETPPAIFFSKGPQPEDDDIEDRIRRSESLGYDFSANFFDSVTMESSSFLTPISLWEGYHDTKSQHSVEWVADGNYSEGDPILGRSFNYNHPFNSILEQDVTVGDTIAIQNLITTRLFIANDDGIYMTYDALRFGKTPEWFLISSFEYNGVEGIPQCMAYSANGNYLWVGTQEGRLFRISNIEYAYAKNEADVESPNCVIATTEIDITTEGISQVITSVSVDPKDENNVIITLGNYGNTDYVYYCNNGRGDVPEFTSKQGDLPEMPVYSSILEMDEENDIAIIGTEKGIWITDNIESDNVSWTYSSNNIELVPVMALKQQNAYKSSATITHEDPGGGPNVYEVYPEVKNYGLIYAATFGRGIFREKTFQTVGIDETKYDVNNGLNIKIGIYPNPASNNLTVSFNLKNKSDIVVNIYDLNGRIVKSQEAKGINAGNNNIPINMQSLSKGSYLLQLVSEEGTGTAKLVIVK